MPELVHTEACKKCPFRRDSAPGWLGDDTPENFVSNALADFSDKPLPCHPTINYENPNWLEKQYPRAPLCAGALIFCKNNMKLPRDAERAEWVRSVQIDSEVFSTPNEFIDHHQPGGNV